MLIDSHWFAVPNKSNRVTPTEDKREDLIQANLVVTNISDKISLVSNIDRD
jgi:hypothetical protein